MSASSPTGPASDAPLRVSEVFRILPRVPELGPFLDLLVTKSVPDPDRRWTGSGELGTVGDRLVDPDGAEATASELAGSEARRIAEVLGTAAGVVESSQTRIWCW